MADFFSSPESQDQVRVIFLFAALVLLVISVYRRRISRIKTGTASIEASETKRLSDLTKPSSVIKQIYSRTSELVFFENIRFGVSIFVGSVVLIYISAFAFSRPISRNAEEWGQFGDFFGGVLNPALAFASFIALLYTIRLQSEELGLTRDELKRATKAHEEMADEAIKAGERSLHLEQYRHASDRVRNGNQALEELLHQNFKTERSITFNEEAVTTIKDLYGALFFCGVHKNDWEERLEFTRKFLTELVKTSQNWFALRSELSEFIFTARRQKSYISAYANYCEKLGYPLTEDTLEFEDIRDSCLMIAKAVFLAKILQNYSVDALAPKLDNPSSKIFLQVWENHGLPLTAF